MKLENRTAFITGAASGLGAEIARVFAREGARVFVTDVDAEGAERVARECASITAGARSARCDVADSGSVRAAFRAFDDAFGALDVLVNNAGIIHRVPEYVERVRATMEAQLMEAMTGEGVKTHSEFVEAITDEMFDRMLKIHLYGTFYCTREALPRMRARGNGGRIINMGSIMGSASLAGAPDYCAAKGAIMAFTRAVAREAASYGVLVNAIAPGFIETPLLDDLDETARRVVKMQTPLARLGVPEEIAAVALFLAGPDSTFMTGQVVSPNGGIYMSQ
jgi:3-oxoacyl-[acyl-carrier protein] reductase